MLRFLSAAAIAVAAVGCSPSVRLVREVPAQYNLGAVRKVAVLDVRARPGVAQAMRDELATHMVSRRHFELLQAVAPADALELAAAGDRIDVRALRQGPSADAYITATTRLWETPAAVGDERDACGPGEARAQVHFGIVAADGYGLFAKDYWASRQLDKARSEREVRAELVRDVVARFLADVTPVTVTERLELEEADSLRRGVELANDGELAAARAEFERVLAARPGFASALYDLGVVLEASGDFEGAAAKYRQAYAAVPKGLYRDALTDLQRRLEDRRQLSQAQR